MRIKYISKEKSPRGHHNHKKPESDLFTFTNSEVFDRSSAFTSTAVKFLGSVTVFPHFFPMFSTEVALKILDSRVTRTLTGSGNGEIL